jgi:hypothetical protein
MSLTKGEKAVSIKQSAFSKDLRNDDHERFQRLAGLGESARFDTEIVQGYGAFPKHVSMD